MIEIGFMIMEAKSANICHQKNQETQWCNSVQLRKPANQRSQYEPQLESKGMGMRMSCSKSIDPRTRMPFSEGTRRWMSQLKQKAKCLFLHLVGLLRASSDWICPTCSVVRMKRQPANSGANLSPGYPHRHTQTTCYPITGHSRQPTLK